MTQPPVVVAGQGRCGTTMMMRMLDAGGIAPAEGTYMGSYETDLNAIRFEAGRTTKWIFPAATPELGFPEDAYVIYMTRDPRFQAESIRKMLRDVGVAQLTVAQTKKIRDSIPQEDTANVTAIVQAGHRVHVANFDETLRSPGAVAHLIAEFLGVFDLDVDAMAAAVHVRDRRTLPTMDFEWSQIKGESNG